VSAAPHAIAVKRVGIVALSAAAYGGETYFRSVLPWLDRLGGDAEYLVFTRDRRFASLPLPHGRVRLIELPRVRASTLKRLLWEQLVLPMLVRTLGIDVVYTANNVGIFAAPCPFVISIRNMEPLAADLRGMPRRLQGRLVTLRMLTHVSLRRASRIIAVSEYVRDHILGLGVPTDKVRVVYHGVDVPPPSIDGEGVANELKAGFILSAAKFVRYANTETLIRGYHAMRASGVTKTLLIAGGSWDPAYEAEIRGLVRALDLEHSVRFLGYVAHSKVLALLRRATLFIFPSTLEACPFTLLEAMACGATILTTRAGPMPEFCKDGARYFDPFDSRLLAQEAIALLREPAERYRLATVARSRASLYQWEDSVPALLAVLGEAAGRPTR
jgi:glycosyltransferase involved in cell wall biosynthesis